MLREKDEPVMVQARARRKAMRRELNLCECAWPIETYRNGSGHHADCPAHAEYRRTHYGPEVGE